MILPFLLLGFTLARAPAAIPAPIEMPGIGPVLGRDAAAKLGLSVGDTRFASLRFVGTDSAGYLALVGTRVRGVAVEQAVEVRSDIGLGLPVRLAAAVPADINYTNGLIRAGLRHDVPGLGPPSVARSITGALSFATLGFGTGVIVGTAQTYDPQKRANGWPQWRTDNLTYTLRLSSACAAGFGVLGWLLGSRQDAGRPRTLAPRCAVAAFDYAGVPIYEEEVRQRLGPANTLAMMAMGTLAGTGLCGLSGWAVSNQFPYLDQWNDPNGLGDMYADVGLVPGLAALSLFYSSTIGRNMDRRAAVEAIRRDRPFPPAGADGRTPRGPAANSFWRRLVFQGYAIRGSFGFAPVMASGGYEPRNETAMWDAGVEMFSLGIGYRVKTGWAVAVGVKGAEQLRSLGRFGYTYASLPVYLYVLRYEKRAALDSRAAYIFAGTSGGGFYENSYVNLGVGAQLSWWGLTPGAELRCRVEPLGDRPGFYASLGVTFGVGGWYFQ